MMVINLIIKSFSIFVILTLFHIMLGNLDEQTVALIVFAAAAIIFSGAFISAVLKDKVQKRKTSGQTVFGS